MNGGIGIQSLLYIVALIGLLLAVFYTIYVTRRERRRRRIQRNGGVDPEMAQRPGPATWRPDSGDEASPPQYMSYMLDQPYAEPETVIVYPEGVYYGNGLSSTEDSTAGLIQQHLAIHNEQQQQQQQMTEAVSQEEEGGDSDSARPILGTTTTTTTTTVTTTTTRSITAPSPTLQLSPRGPLVITTTTLSSSSSSPSSPSSEQAPGSRNESRGIAFLSGRHLNILRRGLKNIGHHHHHQEENDNNDHHGSNDHSSSSTSPSPSGSSSPRNSATPRIVELPEEAESTTPADSSNDQQQQQDAQSGSEEVTGVLELHRFRSMGPPPYAMTGEIAPRLPPSYNTLATDSTLEEH
ncbi:hypothetical protein BGX31_002111 [Mortierella sp. GBA43]|nr:hypothetical protein BGX31_002111 [Mortierella sp. GBA43]